MKVFAAHNPNGQIRRQSSAGGVFTMLAQEIIRQGGVVYGAAFDDEWHVAHKRVETENGLAELRGSKYVYSLVGEAYVQAQADLEAGRKVLFSGTPCQVAAMRKRAGDHPLLLLVEVVCHGAPDSIYWEKYLEEICRKHNKDKTDIEVISFRDKRTGWRNYSFTIKFDGDFEFSEPHDENVYMRAFLKDYTLREACFRCPFKYPDGSKADITIGDFWGIEHFDKSSDDLGVSLVVLRTEKGMNLCDRILKGSNIYHFEEISQYNPALIQCAVKPSNYLDFKNDLKSRSLLKAMQSYTNRPLSLKLKLKINRFLDAIFRNLRCIR